MQIFYQYIFTFMLFHMIGSEFIQYMINFLQQDCAPEGPGLIFCNSPKGYSVGDTLRYGLQLDGTEMYENFAMFSSNTIKIVIDPVPTREDDIVQDYKPVFETELTIEVITDRELYSHLNLKPFVATQARSSHCVCVLNIIIGMLKNGQPISISYCCNLFFVRIKWFSFSASNF